MGQSTALLYLPHWTWTLLLSMSRKELGRREGEEEGGWGRQREKIEKLNMRGHGYA